MWLRMRCNRPRRVDRQDGDFQALAADPLQNEGYERLTVDRLDDFPFYRFVCVDPFCIM